MGHAAGLGATDGPEILVPAAAAPVTGTTTETTVPSAPPVEPDPETVTPGLLGLVILVALGLAVAFLYRSMNRQLKKVDFDDGSGPDSSGPDGTGAGGTDGDGLPR